MIIASLNCKKRLSNPKVNALLIKWLNDNNIDLFFAQEPWPHSLLSPIDLIGFRRLGGNSKVFSWCKEGYFINDVILLEPFMLQINIGFLSIFNMYFDAYSRKARSEQLTIMKERLEKGDDQPIMILGDFNLAPSLEDGMNGKSYSKFNGIADRGALINAITSLKLVDTTNKIALGKQEYSIEMKTGQSLIKFRCDLCLTSNLIYENEKFSVRYDHLVRDKITGFTDHSALIISFPEQ